MTPMQRPTLSRRLSLLCPRVRRSPLQSVVPLRLMGFPLSDRRPTSPGQSLACFSWVVSETWYQQHPRGTTRFQLHYPLPESLVERWGVGRDIHCPTRGLDLPGMVTRRPSSASVDAE